MANESPRRLAAILAADIADYSRLMGADEIGTHTRVRKLRRELIDPTIAEHRGHLIKNTGDGFLVMFDSPVEAVRCAVVIQQSVLARNLELPRPQWIRYRIGVNLGDVIVEPEDIYGDGVNIAARLEQLAEPGSVYISGGIYEQIKYKLVCGYQSLGDRKVKNITDPVPIYRVLPDPAAVARATRRAKWRLRGIAAASMLILVGGVAGGLYAWRLPAGDVTTGAGTSSTSGASGVADPGAGGSRPAGSIEQRAAVVVPRPEAPTQPVPPSPPEPEPASVKGPPMVGLPGGAFQMGSNDEPSEKPLHQVTVQPFLIGKYPVSVREWKECVAARACAYKASGGDDAPVANLSWSDAQQFIVWLSQATGKKYRLPTEAEWEYAARGGTTTKYWWGNLMAVGTANCKGCGEPYDPHEPMKVGSFLPNPFGLFDMAGGVAEWVQDCWHKDYQGAPKDGSAWISPDCRDHVLRGGSWRSDPSYLRASSREYYDTGVRYPTHGFRVARSQ